MSATRSKSTLFSALFFAAMAFSSASHAAPGAGGKKGPPPEAIEACADLSEGDACSFTGPRDDELTGTCKSLPGGEEKRVCAPEGAPDQGGRPE